MKSVLCSVLLCVVVLGCASSPEAQLKAGYASSSVAVRSTTVLVDRDAISVGQGKRISTIAKAAKETLDAEAEALRQCRAMQAAGSTVKCTAAEAGIRMGSGILLELEAYLEAAGKTK